MRYLAIDYGNRKVGLAISDESGRFAFPLKVLKNDKNLVEEIQKISSYEKIEKIVMGDSADLSGKENSIQKDILVFKTKLEQAINLPVELEREFYTTWEAKRIIDEKQNDPLTDARAAALILKSYIDRTTRG